MSYVPCVPVVYVPMYQARANFSFLRANVPINMPTCQRCANYSTWNPSWHRRANFSISPAKRLTNFSNFFQKNFSTFAFFNYAQICKFQEYLGISRKLILETKNSNFDICKISLRENLVNLKSLTSFSMVHLRLTE